MNRPFRLLVGQFLRRFLDNDLISPNAENNANTALFLAFLIVPNLLGSVLLVFRYGNPWTTPCELMLLGLDDKLAFLSTSMILTALVTVVEWDALWLDARDNAILGPLPISAPTIVGAKLAALGLFVAVVAALVNLVPVLFFPLIWLTTLPIGLGVVLRIVGVHALVSLGSATLAFLAVLGIRGLLVSTMPPRLFRAASTIVQFTAILALVSAFLLSPAFYRHVDEKVATGSRLVQAAPPMWFVGLYEQLTARAVLDEPGVRSGRYVHKGREEDEAVARGAYIALEPAFRVLARRAVIGFGAAFVLAIGLFALGHFRRQDHLAATGAASRQPLWRRRAMTAFALVLGGRRPDARATFVFTLLALARSARHRLYVAGYLAGGIAMIVASQDPRVLRSAAARIGQLGASDPGLLVIQLVLVCSLIVGLRVGFPIPAELKANWIFRVTEPADVRPALAGARRAFRTVAVGFLALLVPLHAALWGWWPAAQHFLAGALISLILVDGLLIGFPKVPFTCPYHPGSSRLRYTWPLYVFLFWFFTYLLAFIEFKAMRDARSFATFALFLAAVLIGLAWARRHNLAQVPGLGFDEQEEGAVQTLGLMP